MTKLSVTALENCRAIIEKIQNHPFNKELAAGSLPMEKFAYYIEQDTLYLEDFARSLALIAAKAPHKFARDFLFFADNVVTTEHELVHGVFRQTYNLRETGKIMPARLAYTSYILQKSSMAPVEIAVAAVLPCFWIYKIVGDSITQNSDKTSQNPYKNWIETYSGEEFGDSVKRAIAIFDEMALSVCDKTRHLMLEAFYQCTVLEWHFWNDSYQRAVFDSFVQDN